MNPNTEEAMKTDSTYKTSTAIFVTMVGVIAGGMVAVMVGWTIRMFC